MSDQFEEKAKEIFDDLYDKMERRVKDLGDQFRENVLPETEDKLKKNIFTSIFISFAAGFVLGIAVMIFGKRK
jgi:ElaB/YqjD/DUF883 family membrane-anchored ribosome-binding protein